MKWTIILEDMDFDGMWLQQDGVFFYTAKKRISVLAEKFWNFLPQDGQKLIGQSDLAFFLGGHFKSKVHVNKSNSTVELENETRRVNHQIDPTIFKDGIENFLKRNRSCSLKRNYFRCLTA